MANDNKKNNNKNTNTDNITAKNGKEDNTMNNNTNALSPISSSTFLSQLPEDEISIFNENMVLFTPESTYFYPLVLWKDGDEIKVTPQADLPKDQVANIFGSEDVVPVATYSFTEKELQKHFGEDKELLVDLLVFHDAHLDIDIQIILAMMSYLEDAGKNPANILNELDSLADTELENLVKMFEEKRSRFLLDFTRMLSPTTNYGDEDY